MDKILVLGASGYVGGRLVRRLLREGYAVRCLVRDPRKLVGRIWPGVEIVQGNVLNLESLLQTMRGCNAVYYLVHSMSGGVDRFEGELRGASNTAHAASECGVQRIIYLGALGSRRDALSQYLRNRSEVEEALASGTVPVTRFRAAMIVGSGSASFDMMHALANRLPIMMVPRWVNTISQPIATRDVIRYLVSALTVPESAGKVIDIGGTDILSFKEMILRLARHLDLKRRIIVLPILMPRLSSLWINLATPIHASLARSLVEGMRSEMVAGNDLALRLFPLRPMGFDEAVARALQRVRDQEVETTWSDASLVEIESSGDNDEAGLLSDVRRIEVAASPESVYKVFSSIGGQNGWYFGNVLWRVRGFMDKMVGGVGLRRGRRHPLELLSGDALDFWRVETVETGRRIVLRAEMKVPGRAWLEFCADPISDSRTSFTQTARFYPRGVPGLAYWYGIFPVHAMMFAGMARAIARRAERES